MSGVHEFASFIGVLRSSRRQKKGGNNLSILIFNRLPHDDVPYNQWLKEL